jgi:hypothetical protein
MNKNLLNQEEGVNAKRPAPLRGEGLKFLNEGNEAEFEVSKAQRAAIQQPENNGLREWPDIYFGPSVDTLSFQE